MTALELITKADLELIHEKIDKVLTLLDKTTETTASDWLKSSDVIQLLRCGSSTLAGYRAKGILSARKIGGVYYYNRREVMKLLTSEST